MARKVQKRKRGENNILKEQSEASIDTQFTSKQDSTLPHGWPTDIPLPTLEEAEEAVRKVGELIIQFRQEDRDKFQELSDGDMRRTIITI